MKGGDVTQESINELVEYFNKIKNTPFNKSLRKGPTGIGYTFESLLNKKEDRNYLPDFKGIELKTKLGFSKAPLTLFTLTPQSIKDYPIKYILDTFGSPDKNHNDLKAFRGDVYHNSNNLIANKYIFKTKVDRVNNKLCLVILDREFNVINENIYWDFETIKARLNTKLNYLAVIKGYPYKIKNETFYKYTNLEIFKLKSFDIFLKLIENDEIHITFNIGCLYQTDKYGQLKDRGTAFRINQKSINRLFEKIL